MAPVDKQKHKKELKSTDKQGKNDQNTVKAVVSGQLQKKISKNKWNPQKKSKGVVFIKHLPHGFFEDQLKKYFEQFGVVTRVRLARSRRTGNTKGYAFVEFDYPEVAEVAAQTMNNYLMFKKLVKASYISPENQQFNYFRSSVKKIRNKSGKLIWVSKKTAAIHKKMEKQNDWSEANYEKRTKKQLNKIKKIGEKYAHLGIDTNKIIIPPNKLAEKEKELREKSEANVEKKQNTTSVSKQIKRKTLNENVACSDIQKAKKSKNKVSLADLLGRTIEEESDDEDFNATSSNENTEQSSDEETYGFTKSSSDEDKEQDEIKIAKSKKKSGKILNPDRFSEVVKRKPHTGGIEKLNKKPLKKPPVKTKTAALQVTAAKEVAKPLSKIKGKLNKPLITKKKLVKVK